MIHKTLQIGSPKLREVSALISPEELGSKEIEVLKADLLDTLRAQPTGAGLSAVQIGEARRMFVIEVKAVPNRPQIKPFGPVFFINPEITERSPEEVEMYEGCISVMDAQLFGQVKRPAQIILKYLSENGKEVEEEYEGFLARVIQHEYDHLEGKLFTDVADVTTLATVDEYRKLMAKRQKDK